MKVPAIVGGSLLALGTTGWFAMGVRDVTNPPVRDLGIASSEDAGSISLLGQFRTNISAWLWLRTDLYLHNGVEMRRLTVTEERAGRKGVGGEESGKNKQEQMHDDSMIVTVIPMAEDDFRGIFGDIERATKAHKDMRGHGHNDPKDALPLFRLMTWIDPQFIRGWTTGAIVKARGRTKEDNEAALKFLAEGLKQNPNSLDIRTQIAYLWATRQGRFDAAIGLLEETRAMGRDRIEILSHEEKDGLNGAYQWLGLIYERQGNWAKASEVGVEGFKLFPDDRILWRLQFPPPIILTRDGRQKWFDEKAKTEPLPIDPMADEHDH